MVVVVSSEVLLVAKEAEVPQTIALLVFDRLRALVATLQFLIRLVYMVVPHSLPLIYTHDTHLSRHDCIRW